MARYKDYKHLSQVVAQQKLTHWPKVLPKIKIVETGDLLHLWKFTFFLKRLEIWFSIPLPARYVERYELQHLSTFKGHAKRRLLVCIDYVPFRGLRRQWQEKFKPVEGTWMDDYPPEIMEKRNASKNS